MITSFLVIIFFCCGQKKYSAKKKKILTTNEVTHPTETPLYLWYDVFTKNFCVKKKSKNSHNFWLRASRGLLRSFLEVAFFWSFRGRYLIFCISCFKNLKKVWWWHKKISVNFFRPKYNIFLGYLKNYKPHHFFLTNYTKNSS